MSSLKNAAAVAVIGSQPSTFYERENRPNPVLQTFEQELKTFSRFMKKRSTSGHHHEKKAEEESSARIFRVNTLIELWNKYQPPRLPPLYYKKKLVETGDFLLSLKKYRMAVWQCYERYLQINGAINVEDITDVTALQAALYPNGFQTENAELTSRALIGKGICIYQIVNMNDQKLQSKQSIEKCLQILSYLRLVTQVILPRESLCWLVYNGTIHIYSICRHLMTLGHSSRVLEYLLWASMCMETSVPLLTVKYLSWRATLYTAVCQCYYDCKAGEHAESFARRCLNKIHELSNLELLSSGKDMVVYEDSFRSATVRMAVMVFKRVVIETRRKPKGLLRPKTRVNLKETLSLPWPRTPTENMLAEMFAGGSAQFLAILEALSNSNRRILQTSPPTTDSEPEILDAYNELMMAGQEILAGGGGTRATGTKSQMATGAAPLTSVTLTGSLIQMASKGEDNVPLESVIRLVKLAYAYELWEVFEALLTPTVDLIKESKDISFRWDEKALELLSAMFKMNSSQRQKKQTPNIEEEEVDKTTAQSKKGKVKQKTVDRSVEKLAEPDSAVKSNNGDDLIRMADVLLSIVTGPYQQNEIDIDLVVDATLLIWGKCKPIFQKYQTGLIDRPQFLQKMENPNKEPDFRTTVLDARDTEWMYLLDTVHQAISWCGTACVDPLLAAEVVLRLALIYESSARLESLDVTKSDMRKSRLPLSSDETQKSNPNADLSTKLFLGVEASAKDKFIRAREILQLGLTNVNCARRAVAINDEKNIADVIWVKELHPDIFTSATSKNKTEGIVNKDVQESHNSLNGNGPVTVMENMIKDFHLELLLTYHRVCLKLSALGKRKLKQTKLDKTENPAANITDSNIDDFTELCNKCKKNYLSKALLLAQKAVCLGTENGPSDEQKKLLEDAASLLHRVQTEEKKIVFDNAGVKNVNEQGKVPPPPVLVCRTDTFMVFKPAPFEPESGVKVAWYRIFARNASGNNVKVRLSDDTFPGTGEEIPSFNCEMKVKNLEPGERYLFAVAAYTINGKLIGESIGETSKPLLASHPLPVLMAWAFISQMAYQVGYYSIASQACSVLWDHFVIKPQTFEDATHITETEKDFQISLLRLNEKAVCLSSPVLLRQFLASIFINTDIAVKEGQLFCDAISDKGIYYDRQIQRLQQCERMLVAIELAGWINEINLALQAVVQIYGLLAPMMYHKIPSISVVQILQRCLAVLQEIPLDMIQKRQSSVSESLNHMIACITYHLAKTLRAWGQKDIANSTVESVRHLLASDAGTKLMEDKVENVEHIDSTDKGVKRRKSGPSIKKEPKVEISEVPSNKELLALEAHMMASNQTAVDDHELQGNEDPNVLHAYISCLPSSVAFKEVAKFKSKQRYLEFLVHLSQKGLNEGLADQVIQWCEDGVKWLTKRNENIIGSQFSINKQPGAMVVSGDDPKKFAAAMVEYKKDGKGSRGEKTPSVKTAEKKRTKYKPLRVTASMSDTAQKQQEEAELKALDTLSVYLVDIIKTRIRRKQFRKIAIAEMPWRSQMNIIQGLSHFNILLQKLEKRERLHGISINRTNYLDPEWFALETAGVMIVGWEGGPAKYPIDLDTVGRAPDDQIKLGVPDKQTPSLIEFVAAAVTDSAPPAINNPSNEPPDSPHTNKSVPFTIRPDSKELTTGIIIEALRNTFIHFKRAIVLAHRGQHWTLLQNAGQGLWNCAYTALLHASTTDQISVDRGLLTIDILWSLLWHPFYIASDCLLDMMTVLQDSQEKKMTGKNKGKFLENCYESWVGTIQSDQGGASLKFDPLLDNASIVDVRWIRRLALRTMELLYSQQKYEKLVDIALRFNALTNNRYAEQVIPLIVQAQRLLERRVKQVGGAAPPQPHFKVLQAQLGHVITAKDYLKAQLIVQIDKEALIRVAPGTQIDPIGHGAYKQQDAFRLSAVPLDTVVNIRELQDTLDQAHYTARTLQHSRKLLCLYLAGQQNVKEGLVHQETPHVDFKMATGQQHPTVPPNKILSDFSSCDDVQFSPIPQSQLNTVISSYEKTIEMLSAKNQKGISAQAMHELGNIFFHAQNTKSAFKWWCQSLDLVLNTKDAIHTWRKNLENAKDISAAFLNRCGLWGCLLAGVLASNIAQYILTDDSGLRIECCLLAGFLFKALFRSSLPHPTADRDYALYDVGEGCQMTSLTPGVNFMSDKFRCDGRQLVGALKWVTEELSRAQYNLFMESTQVTPAYVDKLLLSTVLQNLCPVVYVLPLLTLSQYFTICVCRDVQQAVEGKILRVRVLTDLGFYAEAFTALQQLLNGEHLPQIGDSSFILQEAKNMMTYSSSKSAADVQNLKGRSGYKCNVQGLSTCRAIWNKSNYLAIESLLIKKLSINLSTLFGPHLTCHLALVQAHLLISLANTIPVLPKIGSQIIVDRGKSDIQGAKSTISKAQTNVVAGTSSGHDVDNTLDSASVFKVGSRNLSLEDIKGTILAVAEQTVTSMTNVILEKTSEEKKGVETLPAAELELLVQCQFEQACIAMQKHHAPLAARTMVGILKVLEGALIFKKNKPPPSPLRPSSIKSCSAKSSDKSAVFKLSEPEKNILFHYQNIQARLRLDTRLWLRCRCELIRSLMMEIRGMGDIVGNEDKIVSDLADCRQYCAEGLEEADACMNHEMQAHFLFLGAQLNVIEGKSLEHTISLLEDALGHLRLMKQCSDAGKLLLVTCIMFKTDLEAIAKSDKNSDTLTQKTLTAYHDAQKIILKQMELLGERTEHMKIEGQIEHLSSPVSPLQNIYLPYVEKLAQVKLRIGHAMARSCAKMIRNGYQSAEAIPVWENSLHELCLALEISQVSALRNASLESEILLMMGKVQKMMVYQGKYDARVAANTLLRAIKICYINSHDLGLIRQAYLEIALVYMYSSDLITIKDCLHKEPVKTSNDSVMVESTQKNSKKNMEKELERRAAWLAVRCATVVAYAQQSRSIIIGDKSVTARTIEGKAISSLPDFLLLDLLSRNVLGKARKTYKNVIEEELARLTESQEVKVFEPYDIQINKVKLAARDISWIHVLGYQTILQRLVNTATLSVTNQRTAENRKDDKCGGLDLNFISNVNSDSGMSHDVVRYMLHSGGCSIRLAKMHSYLCTNLKAYAKDCSAPYPPAELTLPKLSHKSADSKTTRKSYYINHALNFDSDSVLQSDGVGRVTLPPGSSLDPFKRDDNISSVGVDTEFSIQWYQPDLEEVGGPQSSIDGTNKQIVLMYTFVNEEYKMTHGIKCVELNKVYDLHDRFALMAQKVDILIIAKKKLEPFSSPSEIKIEMRNKALSPKLDQDKQLELLFKQCLDDAWTWIKGTPKHETVIVPEISVVNLKNLKNIFDPSLGLTLKGTDLLPWLLELVT